MKQSLVMVFLVAVLMLSLSLANAQDEYDPSKIAWTCPKGFEGQTLNVFNWSYYIGRHTLKTFEEQCGVEVNYDLYNNVTEMFEALLSGETAYDIAFAPDFTIATLRDNQLVEPLDIEKIPNLANVNPSWLNFFSDVDRQYVAPYMWGTTGIAYNTEKVAEAPDSWMDLFEHDGPVVWLDGPRTMLSVALKLLGYDPNSTDSDELAQASEFLIEHAQNVLAVADDDGQALLESGEADIVVEYGGDIYQLILDCECTDFAYVLPQEGAILDLTSMVLLRNGQNSDLALAFMDYILDPYVNGQISNEIAYPTANKAAIDGGFVDRVLLNSPVYTNFEEVPESYFVKSISSADASYYNQIWKETLAAIGK